MRVCEWPSPDPKAGRALVLCPRLRRTPPQWDCFLEAVGLFHGTIMLDVLARWIADVECLIGVCGGARASKSASVPLGYPI